MDDVVASSEISGSRCGHQGTRGMFVIPGLLQQQSNTEASILAPCRRRYSSHHLLTLEGRKETPPLLAISAIAHSPRVRSTYLIGTLYRRSKMNESNLEMLMVQRIQLYRQMCPCPASAAKSPSGTNAIVCHGVQSLAVPSFFVTYCQRSAKVAPPSESQGIPM